MSTALREYTADDVRQIVEVHRSLQDSQEVGIGKWDNLRDDPNFGAGLRLVHDWNFMTQPGPATLFLEIETIISAGVTCASWVSLCDKPLDILRGDCPEQLRDEFAYEALVQEFWQVVPRRSAKLLPLSPLTSTNPGTPLRNSYAAFEWQQPESKTVVIVATLGVTHAPGNKAINKLDYLIIKPPKALEDLKPPT